MMVTTGLSGTTGGQDRNTTELIVDAFKADNLVYPAYYGPSRQHGREEIKYRKMGGFAELPEIGEGQSLPIDTMAEIGSIAFAIFNYALGFVLSHEMKRSDDEWGLARDFATLLGGSLFSTLRTSHALPVNRSFNTAFPILGAGAVPLCSATHKTAGGFDSNVLDTPADLTATQLENMMKQGRTRVNFRGLDLGFDPKVLLAHTDYEFDAKRALKSGQAPGGSLNDINAVQDAVTYVGERFIDDTDAWWLVDPSKRPLDSAVREAPRPYAKPHPLAHDAQIYYVYGSWRAAPRDPGGIMGTPGA